MDNTSSGAAEEVTELLADGRADDRCGFEAGG